VQSGQPIAWIGWRLHPTNLVRTWPGRHPVTGTMPADGYAGFDSLYRPTMPDGAPPLIEVGVGVTYAGNSTTSTTPRPSRSRLK
jgi:hypothetical protein